MWIKREDMPVEVREKMRDGTGSTRMQDMLPKGKPAHMRLFSMITLNPGDSIGQHVHEGETEIYLILAGQGLVDDDGVEIVVNVGDTVSTGGGAGHSIACAGDKPLVLAAVIVTEA